MHCQTRDFFEKILIKIEFSLHLIKSLTAAAAHEKWRSAKARNTKNYARDELQGGRSEREEHKGRE